MTSRRRLGRHRPIILSKLLSTFEVRPADLYSAQTSFTPPRRLRPAMTVGRRRLWTQTSSTNKFLVRAKTQAPTTNMITDMPAKRHVPSIQISSPPSNAWR